MPEPLAAGAGLVGAYVLLVWVFGAVVLWRAHRAVDEERRLLGYRPTLALYAAMVVAVAVTPYRLAWWALARLWVAAAAGAATLARRWRVRA